MDATSAPSNQMMEWPDACSDHESRVRALRAAFLSSWCATRPVRLIAAPTARQMVYRAIEPLAGHFCIGDRVNAKELKESVVAEAAVLMALTDKKRANIRDPMTRVRPTLPWLRLSLQRRR